MGELYRDFLDRKFDELLQAIQALNPPQRVRQQDAERGQNGTNTR